MNPYYGVRRLGPYLGVIQVIDVGDACAYSINGHTWRIRQQTASGRLRWGVTQISDGNLQDVRIVNADNLVEALKKQPPVPFPILTLLLPPPKGMTSPKGGRPLVCGDTLTAQVCKLHQCY